MKKSELKLYHWIAIFLGISYIGACAGEGYYVITSFRFISYIFSSLVGILIFYLLSIGLSLNKKLKEKNKVQK